MSKAHTGCQDKTKQADHWHVVPTGWNAGEYDERTAHDQGCQDNGIGDAVGDALQGELQRLNTAMLKTNPEMATE